MSRATAFNQCLRHVLNSIDYPLNGLKMVKFCQTSSNSLAISRYYLRYFPCLTAIYLIFITIFKIKIRPKQINLLFRFLFGDTIDSDVCQQVGCLAYQCFHKWRMTFFRIADGKAVDDMNIMLCTKLLKIFKRTQMNVWGVIPLIRQCL